MTNMYGARLDENGYARSIIDQKDECLICGKGGDLVRHEIFFGSLYRNRSKELGLWVKLCPACHQDLHAQKGGYDDNLKEIGQMMAMNHYGWTTREFRQRFGKNYL